jgi:DNA-binding transcriptional LysR family regulator
VHFLDRVPDILEEGFDGVVRFGPMDDSAQVARLMQHAHGVVVATPALPGLDTLTHPDDLAGVPLIGLAASWATGWPLICGTETIMVAVRPQLALGSYLAIRDAAIAGAGVAMMPYLLAKPDIDAGRLIRVLPDWESPRKALHFVYPSAQSITARLRVFIDFLAVELRESSILNRRENADMPPVPPGGRDAGISRPGYRNGHTSR